MRLPAGAPRHAPAGEALEAHRALFILDDDGGLTHIGAGRFLTHFTVGSVIKCMSWLEFILSWMAQSPMLAQMDLISNSYAPNAPRQTYS